MWTDTTRKQFAREGLRLPSDLTNAEWALLEPLPAGDVEGVMDEVERAVPGPKVEVAVNRALGRQVLRDRPPLAAGRENIDQSVDCLAQIGPPPSAARLARRVARLDQRRDQDLLRGRTAGIESQRQVHVDAGIVTSRR